MDSLLSLNSPFASYLEAPDAVINMWRVHGGRINATMAAAEECLTDLLIDLVAEIWEVPASLFVTDSDLRRHGFDTSRSAPDPDDYW